MANLEMPNSAARLLVLPLLFFGTSSTPLATSCGLQSLGLPVFCLGEDVSLPDCEQLTRARDHMRDVERTCLSNILAARTIAPLSNFGFPLTQLDPSRRDATTCCLSLAVSSGFLAPSLVLL